MRLYQKDETMRFEDRIFVPLLIMPFTVYLGVSYYNLNFTQPPYFTFGSFLGMYITLTIVWFFNRELLLFSRHRFPGINNTAKRLLFETSIFLVQSTLLLLGLTYFVIEVCGYNYDKNIGHTLRDTQILNLEVALWIGTIVEVLYESLYYYSIINQSKKDKYLSEQYEFFLTVIAHDILGPVRFMKSVTDELFSNGDKIEESSKKIYIKELFKAQVGLYDFLVEFLTWAKLKSDKSGFKNQINLKAFYNKIVEYKVKTNPSISQNIMIDVPENLSILCNEKFLNIIFNNLLENACKYTPEGNITLFAKVDGNNFLLGCSDSGKGMEQQQIDDIYAQMNSNDMNFETSFNLGYKFIIEIIKVLGAKLKIESELNKGTSISLLLDVAKVKLPK